MIHDIDELLDLVQDLKTSLTELRAEHERTVQDLQVCRNELCLRCGSYRTAHLGSCDGCRWRKS